MTELIPQLGDPVDVQRRLEFSIAPDLEWTVLCYLDLETLKPRADAGPAPTVLIHNRDRRKHTRQFQRVTRVTLRDT